MRSDTNLLPCPLPGLMVSQTPAPGPRRQPFPPVAGPLLVRNSSPPPRPCSDVTFSGRPCPPCPALPGFLSLPHYCLLHLTSFSHAIKLFTVLIIYYLPSIHTLLKGDHVLVVHSSQVLRALLGTADTQHVCRVSVSCRLTTRPGEKSDSLYIFSFPLRCIPWTLLTLSRASIVPTRLR